MTDAHDYFHTLMHKVDVSHTGRVLKLGIPHYDPVGMLQDRCIRALGLSCAASLCTRCATQQCIVACGAANSRLLRPFRIAVTGRYVRLSARSRAGPEVELFEQGPPNHRLTHNVQRGKEVRVGAALVLETSQTLRQCCPSRCVRTSSCECRVHSPGCTLHSTVTRSE
jgi:hypothetical protein